MPGPEPYDNTLRCHCPRAFRVGNLSVVGAWGFVLQCRRVATDGCVDNHGEAARNKADRLGKSFSRRGRLAFCI